MIYTSLCNKNQEEVSNNCGMNLDTILALAAFALVSSITPGPNNLMLMASGANFGFRRTLPHMAGVCLGFMFMLFVVGAGLVSLFDWYPRSYDVLRVVSVCYLLYLAWKIATAAPATDDIETGKPFTFIQAALFQWVNPKAWVMAISANSIYAPEKALVQIAIITVVFGLVNLPSISCWTVMGQQMRRLLNKPWRLRLFNGTMAVLLIVSLVPVLSSL